MSTPKKILASLSVLAAVAAFMSFGVFSSFSNTKSNSSSLSTATLALTQLPAAGNLFGTLTGLVPGDLIPRCVKLTNDSDTPVTVDAAPSISDTLSSAAKLSLIEVSGIKTDGTDPSTDIKNCVPSGASLTTVKTYLTNVSGTIATQHLVSDPVSSSTTWAAGESHFYEVTVAVPSGLTNVTDFAKTISPAISFTATALNGATK